MPNHNHHSKYKTQKRMWNHDQVTKICCSFLPSREIRHINTQAKKSIKLSSETLEQGLVKEYDNKDDETEEVEDKDMKDQDDIGNHNVNINCKENDDDVDCNNETQNMVKNEVIIKNNYIRIEVVEECNDENKSVQDDLNQDNVKE